jgi:hypothetical protein
VAFSVTGVQGTTALGETTETGTATVYAIGVQGSTALGTVAVESDANVNVTGVQGTTALGETTETGTATVYAIGVQATGQAGNRVRSGVEIVPNSGNNAEIGRT